MAAKWKKAGGRWVLAAAGGGKAFVAESAGGVDAAVHIPDGEMVFRFDSHSFGPGAVKQAKNWCEIRIGQEQAR